MANRVKLFQIMNPVEYAKFVELWNNTTPAPDDGSVPDWDMQAAFDGCLNLCGFDISVLSREEQDELADAANNPDGPGPHAEALAARHLRKMAHRDGWISDTENYLNDPEYNN